MDRYPSNSYGNAADGKLIPLPNERTYHVRVARSTENGISTGVQQFTVALEERMTVLDALFRIQRSISHRLNDRRRVSAGWWSTCRPSAAPRGWRCC